MTPTEVFKLFLKHGLTPNERLAFVTEIRVRIRCNDLYLWRKYWWEKEPLTVQRMENIFAERIMKNSYYITNNLGRYGDSSACCCLSSFMRYLLFYMPSIIGCSKKKNRFLDRETVEIPEKIGYKRFWESRLINKWHKFLEEYIDNYKYTSCDVHHYTLYRLKKDDTCI